MTEPGTRSGLKGPFFRDYMLSVGNMHGWSDGDPFMVNYIGHPLQGSVASFIWIQNDAKKYRAAEFGRNSNYWKSRLRATAWSWAYSTQFELGPLSEASIGNVQNTWPQQGFVDHIITPSIGMAWTIGEDALDKYVIQRFEDRVDNKWARMMVRSWLNPGRSMANAMAFRVPWARETRSGIMSYTRASYQPQTSEDRDKPVSDVSSFEFTTQPVLQKFGNNYCLGGGANGAFRMNQHWQLVVDVSGCTVYGLGENRSGDTLLYQIGPRWTPAAAKRFSPYVEVLLGGHKVTQTYTNPVLKEAWEQRRNIEESKGLPPPKPDFMDFQESNALALKAATGVDVKLTAALALRVANLGYVHTWTSPMNGVNYQNGLQFSSGIVLRLGTW